MLKPTFASFEFSDGALSVYNTAGWVALGWYAFIWGVCSLGYFQMYGSIIHKTLSSTDLSTQMEALSEPTATVPPRERRRRATRHCHPTRERSRATPL